MLVVDINELFVHSCVIFVQPLDLLMTLWCLRRLQVCRSSSFFHSYFIFYHWLVCHSCYHVVHFHGGTSLPHQCGLCAFLQLLTDGPACLLSVRGDAWQAFSQLREMLSFDIKTHFEMFLPVAPGNW